MSAPDKKAQGLPRFKDSAHSAFDTLPFVGDGVDWQVPADMPLPPPPRAMRGMPCALPSFDWRFGKRYGLGILHARALMRFYFREANATARALACGEHDAGSWADGFLGAIVRGALIPGHELPPEFAGFLGELERWLVHASASHSVLMDAPAVLRMLTPDEWNRQCQAHIEDPQRPENVPDIWPPKVWPAYVVPDALRTTLHPVESGDEEAEGE